MHGEGFATGNTNATRDVWEGRKPIVSPEARRIGALALVEIGMRVFEAAPDESDYDPRGGVCVAIDERVDPETGEVERTFTTVRLAGRLIVRRVHESDVRSWSVEIPGSGELAPLIGALCGEVYDDLGKSHPGKGRLILPRHGERIEWARRLYMVAMGVAA